MEGTAILWKFEKQYVIAQSSMEFEFYSLAIAGDEVEWLSNLLGDLPLKDL